MRNIGVAALVFTLIMVGGWFSEITAQQPVEKNPPVEENGPALLQEVVVTASREKESAASVPAQVKVLTSEEIARTTARNVPEALAGIGLHVSDMGGNQRNYVVDLRGFGEVAPLNLLVLVDGRRINQSDLSATDWTLIPLERIERIEVVPGSRGSVLYGDNATAGVINIITKEGRGLEAGLSGAYGSYNSYKTSANFRGSAGTLSCDLFGRYLQSDGYRENSDTRAKDFGANLRMDPSSRVNLYLNGGYHQDDTRLPGAILQRHFDQGASRRDTFHPNDFADTEDYYIQSGLEWFFLTQDAFKLDLSYRGRSFSSYSSGEGFWFDADTDMTTLAFSPHFAFKENFGEVSNRLVLGVDFSQTKEDITNTFFSDTFGLSNDMDQLKRRNQGYYLQDDLGVTRRLTLSGGYRSDRAKYTFGGTSDYSIFEAEAMNAGATYSLGSAKVYLLFGKSFRYPVLDEIFNFTGNTVNTLLGPQSSKSLEAGTQFELIQDLLFRFALFHIQTSGEIYYNPSGGPYHFGANENLDGTTYRDGFTARFSYRRHGWTAGIGYTFTEAYIDGGQYDGSQIPNVPLHAADARVGYTFDWGLFLGLDGIYVGERYLISDFNNSHVQLDPYVLLNAKISYTWRWLTLFADLNNILNQEYSSFGALTYLGEEGYYPSPKFNFLAGFTLRYSRK